MRKVVLLIARLLGFLAFVIILISGYDFSMSFTLENFAPLLFKSVLGALLFGLLSIIIGDIIIKGVMEDIERKQLEPLEGGIEQRMHEAKAKEPVAVIKRDINVQYKDKNPPSDKM